MKYLVIITVCLLVSVYALSSFSNGNAGSFSGMVAEKQSILNNIK